MIVWLSSYPKSGNTWVRAFLTAYLYSTNGKFDFSLIDNIREFPQRDLLNKFIKSKNFHNLKEISKNWISVQELINLNKKPKFLKTHSSFCNINGNYFSNKENTLAFIYIVRDPRNVILSMSNHFAKSHEESFKTLIDDKYTIYPRANDQLFPATHVSSWKTNYLSWKNFKSINKIIIKYEDLIDNPQNTFKNIINFLNDYVGIIYEEEKLKNAISTTKFEVFKKYEDKHGFNRGQKNKFFYRGKQNNWKNLLDTKICSKVNAQFESEMSELGYI